FFAYSANFVGGVTVAAGDTNGDGLAEVITGAGAGGGPHVKVFDASGATLQSFFAFPAAFAGGVFVAAGDTNGDGKADVVVGAGATGVAQVQVFDGTNARPITSFFAYTGFFGGVRVAARDVDGDGRADVITGA